MTKYKSNIIGVLILVSAVLCAYILLYPLIHYRKADVAPISNYLIQEKNDKAESNLVGEEKNYINNKKPAIPSGKQVYQIVQAAETQPKILQATIDPPDVHIGDTQKLSIIVQSKTKIKSAVAYIETDNGTTTLPLNFVGEISGKDFLFRQYALGKNNKLIFLPGRNEKVSLSDNSGNFNFKGMISGYISKIFSYNVAESAGKKMEYQKLKYENSWVVKDTHNRYYHTTFVVEDINGNKNSITIAWSDACGIPTSGNWTISADCTISSVDGVDNGNVTIQNYTLTLNSTFAFNPGHSITVGSGGSIAIGTGGQIKKTYLWITDSDGDNYAPSTYSEVAQDTKPSGYSRRYSISGTSDCNDGWASIWRNVSNLYSDNDQDGYTDSISLTKCVGNSTSISGRTYYWDGYAYSLLYGSNLGWDCNDSNASAWRYRHRDADGDGYGVSANTCVGNDSGYVDDNTDCYDSNANAHPGQTTWFSVASGDRGDGSWDYNCNGAEDKYYNSVSSCAAAPVSECSSAGYSCSGLTPYCVHVTSPGYLSAVASCGNSGYYYSSTGYGCTDSYGDCYYGALFSFGQLCH